MNTLLYDSCMKHTLGIGHRTLLFSFCRGRMPEKVNRFISPEE